MNKKIYFQILIILLVVVLAIGYLSNRFYFKDQINENAFDFINKKLEIETAITPTGPDIPISFEIENVPFQSQAPNAVWDELHDEACEEASVVIVKYYLTGENLTTGKMEEEIQKLVAWQIDNWGGHFDLTAEKTAQLAKAVYGINLEEKPVESAADIQKEISQNNLLIVPTAGRSLGNPNFRAPGPIYHMLVISGYEKYSIITQDVGTRNGKNYKYANSVLFNAIHDWPGSGDNIESGQKVMLVAPEK